MSGQIVFTDPAKEIAEICGHLGMAASKRGVTFLAEQFGLESTGSEFQKLVQCIYERVDGLHTIIQNLNLDIDVKQSALGIISSVRNAFTYQYLGDNWDSTGAQWLGIANRQTILAYSGQVRAVTAYPKLTTEMAGEILSEVDTLIDQLEEIQLQQQEFFRQALLDGLKQFRFRLAYLKWLGWGYCLESLKEVIAVEMALQGAPGYESDPNANATWQAVASFLIGVWTKTNGTVDSALTWYGAYDLLTHFVPQLPKV